MSTRPDEAEATVPSHVLLQFFQTATQALESSSSPVEATRSPPITKQLRQCLLSRQQEALQQVVVAAAADADDSNHFTLADVQTALTKDFVISSDDPDNMEMKQQLKRAKDTLNQTARQTYCEWVLQGALRLQEENDNLDLVDDSGSMTTSDVLEFCGLCQAAVQLVPSVPPFLARGTPLFENQGVTTTSTTTTTTALVFPSDRMEHIQRLFLLALGYNPDFGARELQRLLNEPPCDNPAVSDALAKMATCIRMALAQAAAVAQQETIESPMVVSQDNNDGVTRVVSVQYSEKWVDAATGQEVSAQSDVPQPEQMTEQQQRHSNETTNTTSNEWQLAREASLMQQEILGELLTMREEERDIRLQQAKETERKVLEHAMQIPPGPDRISYFLSLDAKTQRTMAMTKLWESMMAANDGQPPKMR